MEGVLKATLTCVLNTDFLYVFESIRDQFWTVHTSRSFNQTVQQQDVLKNYPLACINNFNRSKQTTKSLKLPLFWSLLRLDSEVLHLACCTTTTGHNFWIAMYGLPEQCHPLARTWWWWSSDPARSAGGCSGQNVSMTDVFHVVLFKSWQIFVWCNQQKTLLPWGCFRPPSFPQFFSARPGDNWRGKWSYVATIEEDCKSTLWSFKIQFLKQGI